MAWLKIMQLSIWLWKIYLKTSLKDLLIPEEKIATQKNKYHIPRIKKSKENIFLNEY